VQPGKPPNNMTKNPITEAATRPQKRTLEASDEQNFIWGNVEHAGKRSKVGEAPLFHHTYSS
jgi:hypothetical protein